MPDSFWAVDAARGHGLGVVKVTAVSGVLPAGRVVTVSGQSVDGAFSWPVRGGVFVADGGQVILVDVAAPINIPVTYSAVWDGGEVSTSPVVRTFQGHEAVVSLDGGTVVGALRLKSGGDAREGERRFHTSAVPGRRRPPVRLGPVAGDGGGSMLLETSSDDTAAMRGLLARNLPVYVFHNPARCKVAECDLPLVDLVYVTGDGNDRSAAVQKAHRRWSLSYLLVDDPDPDYRVPLSTWDMFDAAGLLWGDLDALGLTWDEFDRTDWSQTGV